METKQTAVEWLKKKCEDSLNKEPDDPSEREIGYSIALKHFITLIENKAKAMELEQIEEAYNTTYGFIDGKEYYEKTFK